MHFKYIKNTDYIVTKPIYKNKLFEKCFEQRNGLITKKKRFFCSGPYFCNTALTFT